MEIALCSGLERAKARSTAAGIDQPVVLVLPFLDSAPEAEAVGAGFR